MICKEIMNDMCKPLYDINIFVLNERDEGIVVFYLFKLNVYMAPAKRVQ